MKLSTEQMDARQARLNREWLGQPVEVRWLDGPEGRGTVTQVSPKSYTAYIACEDGKDRAITLHQLRKVEPARPQPQPVWWLRVVQLLRPLRRQHAPEKGAGGQKGGTTTH